MIPRTASLLNEIYGRQPPELVSTIEKLIADGSPAGGDSMWSEQDVVLITYADQIRDPGRSPLQAQQRFLLDHAVNDVVNCVHLLPFCPYSSDDGFSVIDYLAVDPASGDWNDIADLGKSFDLMFDLVLNHCSQHSRMFQGYLAGESEFADFFIDQDPSADLSQVVRPRSLPLLTPFQTASGTKNIWTTFSADQVDLNYANPKVLAAMLEVLVDYAKRGARIIRLDAIAYLWKQVGTSCIHLPQTHAVVRLMRSVLDQAAPGTLVLTETNVPHDENISYFGSGADEAHMVYQFSLPPLMLDAVHSGETTVLRDWLATLAPPTEQTTFFNFTASHDGIGVRPLEGIVPPERVNRLAEIVRSHGGLVNTRRNPDGSDSPYELNITYLDAIADRSKGLARGTFTSVSCHPSDHVVDARHACGLLSLAGWICPTTWTASHHPVKTVGSTATSTIVENSKRSSPCPIRFSGACLTDTENSLSVRKSQPAFHPAAAQRVLDLPGDGLLGFVRETSAGQRLAVLANLTDDPREIDDFRVESDLRNDVLAVERIPTGQPIPMRPFQVRWLTA